jgi:hypothetical protein
MGEFEAIGDAVTGGLLARAVEPNAGEAVDNEHTHEKNCLNCGTPLSGPYCAACGQKSHVHRSLRGFMMDFVQGLFNFEGKIWRTLPMLAWQPGEMTRRYIAGERSRFISPVALYLFTVFAMFAVLNFTGALDSGSESIKTEMKADIAEEQAALAKLEAKSKEAGIPKEALAELNRKIAKRKESIADDQRVVTGVKVDPGDLDETPGWVRPLVKSAQENPELVSLKIQEAASKYSWLLIPISVPFLWLLFPLRRRYNLYDHTVFVTYSLSFMMMLVIIGGVLVAAGSPGLASILFFLPPFHMYRHLKGAYELGKWSAIMRTMALVTFAFIAAGMFLAASVAIGTM